MRTQLLIGGCMVAAAVALIWAATAKAEPPPSMTYTELSVPVIACDSRDQMEKVVQSIKDGNLKETLVSMESVKDEKGEPVCVYSKLGPIVFGESEHIGRLKNGDRTIDTWISNVGNQITGFYVLWGEVVKESSI